MSYLIKPGDLRLRPTRFSYSFFSTTFAACFQKLLATPYVPQPISPRMAPKEIKWHSRCWRKALTYRNQCWEKSYKSLYVMVLWILPKVLTAGFSSIIARYRHPWQASWKLQMAACFSPNALWDWSSATQTTPVCYTTILPYAGMVWLKCWSRKQFRI